MRSWEAMQRQLHRAPLASGTARMEMTWPGLARNLQLPQFQVIIISQDGVQRWYFLGKRTFLGTK